MIEYHYQDIDTSCPCRVLLPRANETISETELTSYVHKSCTILYNVHAYKHYENSSAKYNKATHHIHDDHNKSR